MFCPCLTHLFYFLLLRRPPTSPLFPYTTLFRSAASTRKVPRRATATPARACADEAATPPAPPVQARGRDRKSTRLNSSHLGISYAVFCLKKKKQQQLKHKKITEDKD